MKFINTVVINRPIETVFTLFKDPTYLKEYQDGFVKKLLISGREGEVGVVSEMNSQNGKTTMLITETILVSRFPEAFVGSYHHKHMDNTMNCKFERLDSNSTRYISEVEYTEFRGLLPKILAFLFPKMFKNQVKKWMINFKEFAEGPA